ncbi:MAG: acyltransferase, partial [Alphaproteobacteria bacterium]
SPDWPEGNAAALEAGLTRAVAAARRAGARVVLVAGIPEPGFDVPNALARSLAFGRPPPRGPDAAAHAARQQAARAVLERLARMPGVSLLDPAAILCRPDCAVAREGRPLYFDDDHLSLEGAALMAPLLAPLLR